MNKILSRVAVLAIAIMAVSCSEESWKPEELVEDKGELSLLSMGIEVDTEETVIMRSVPDVSEYIVSIYNSNEFLVEQWRYADMPGIVTLPVGDYILKVKSHELHDAEWEKPYYYDSQSFKIEKSLITELDSVKCRLSNVKVSVAYSEALEAALGNDVRVVISIGSGSLEYVKGEQRAGYFALPDGSKTMLATFDGTVNGKQVSLRKIFTDIEIGQHRVVTFSLVTGSVNPEIIIDAEITDEDITVDVPGEDDVIPGERPEEGEGNAPTIESATLDVDGVNVVTPELVAKVDINVPNGVETLFVEIISESLSPDVLAEVGLASVFDLAHPGDLEEALTDLGFPTGDNVIGKTYLPFDITMFMEVLGLFPGQHQFKLTVTDTIGLAATKTLTFQVQ